MVMHGHAAHRSHASRRWPPPLGWDCSFDPVDRDSSWGTWTVSRHGPWPSASRGLDAMFELLRAHSLSSHCLLSPSAHLLSHGIESSAPLQHLNQRAASDASSISAEHCMALCRNQVDHHSRVFLLSNHQQTTHFVGLLVVVRWKCSLAASFAKTGRTSHDVVDNGVLSSRLAAVHCWWNHTRCQDQCGVRAAWHRWHWSDSIRSSAGLQQGSRHRTERPSHCADRPSG